LATALLEIVPELTWAVTMVGGGWYLLGGALFLCAPLLVWHFLTDRRREG
jgi:hypothetical protein